MLHLCVVASTDDARVFTACVKVVEFSGHDSAALLEGRAVSNCVIAWAYRKIPRCHRDILTSGRTPRGEEEDGGGGEAEGGNPGVGLGGFHGSGSYDFVLRGRFSCVAGASSA